MSLPSVRAVPTCQDWLRRSNAALGGKRVLMISSARRHHPEMSDNTSLVNRVGTEDSRRTNISRKQFLECLGGALGYATFGWPHLGFGEEPSWDRRERIARIIREYDSQGDHRTGSAVDATSGRWLADRTSELGVEAVLERMPFTRTDVQASYVEAGGRSVQGVPVFDGGFTDANGVSGTLGPIGTSADIGIVRLPPFGPELANYRKTSSHRAIIVVTGGERFGLPEGLALINADNYTEPFGPPALQVGSESGQWLESLAAGTKGRVVVHVNRQTVQVFNVTAKLSGSRPDLAPLVVMTPRSGWWTCASERGGGIAVWLELVRELQRIRPARSTYFVASTGHELGHYGLEHYLRTREDLIKDAVAWIHLGANFGAAVRASSNLQLSDDEMQTLALAAMADAGKAPDRIRPVGSRPFGEARNIHDGGGRYISLLGRNGLFHHPYDRWPAAVDLDAVDKFASAFVHIATRLTEE